jgi:hypothetical protein
MLDPDPLRWLAGREPAAPRPLVPFSPQAVAFLAALSKELRIDPTASRLADVHTFAFWCRRANLGRLKSTFDDPQERLGRARLGRGLVLHIAPSNVPVTFAYSFAFGLLAGNAGIVRAPSLEAEPVDVICGAIDRLLDRPEHAELRNMIGIVRYPQGSHWTATFSAHCDGRVLWGIAAIRRMPLPPRAVELTFPDRTSLCVMDAAAVSRLDERGLARLADGFFNDAFLMDQNACSSPHLVVWLGRSAEARNAAVRFWRALEVRVDERYHLEPVQAVEKHTRLLAALIEAEEGASLHRYGDRVAVIGLPRLPETAEDLRGRFGLFWETDAAGIESLAPMVTGRFQTLSAFGLDNGAARDFIVAARLPGIDRIVPVGKALEMGLVWDGFDLIAQLSRIVDRH